ncbi:MAG: response regulator [Bacteroidia bacterium]|nr:response regulator [Bacteroidia bacterium]
MNAHNRICIVDDDWIYQLVIRRMIEKQTPPPQVLTYSNGQEAIDALRAAAADADALPDVLLLDINMPVMDGWEFMDEYLQLKSSLVKPLRIYIISSSIAPQDHEKARSYADISGFLTKPVTEETLERL